MSEVMTIKMIKYSTFILFFFFTSYLKALDLTLYVNNWLDEIPETSYVHTDQYIYLEDKLTSTLSELLDSNSCFHSVRSGP